MSPCFGPCLSCFPGELFKKSSLLTQVPGFPVDTEIHSNLIHYFCSVWIWY